MNLAEYQRAFVRVCFAPEAPAADLSSLAGEASRWRVYRHMVRTRLLNMAKVAFERSHSVLGEARFEACHDRFLASGGVSSPFIREVVHAFGEFAQRDTALALSDYEGDLLRFEGQKWELSYLPAAPPSSDALVDFDFGLEPVLNPVFRIVRFAHPVQRQDADNERPRAATVLFMYRPPGVSAVRWWSPDRFGEELFRRLQQGQGAVAHAVRQAADTCGETLDQALLERLSTLLALTVERGILLGSRPA